MVSTTEGGTYYSPNVPMTSKPIKKLILNHCVNSPTYWRLSQKEQNVVLWLQNQNSEP